jgi:hypothetical protein
MGSRRAALLGGGLRGVGGRRCSVEAVECARAEEERLASDGGGPGSVQTGGKLWWGATWAGGAPAGRQGRQVGQQQAGGAIGWGTTRAGGAIE